MLIHGILSGRVTRTFALAITLSASPFLLRAAKPDAGPSAAQILEHAESQARAEHKNILLEFGASWCINCKLYDRMLADASMHAILGPHFVFTTMDTGERANDARHANTRGAVELENSIGGKDAGWPYLVILSAEGKPIVDSFRPDPKSKTGDNIGYPVLPEEVDWFIVMLHRGAPSISEQDLASVHAWLTAQAAKLHH
ncbi:MAG TPA: thioredoxin family protein [Terracidiphilus sp.]|nr:thioredoxin family protein [Terracidiphilus sp.]